MKRARDDAIQTPGLKRSHSLPSPGFDHMHLDNEVINIFFHFFIIVDIFLFFNNILYHYINTNS